ncbi:hypothetical protein BOTNAR_0049g00090 [Botryotinia narcissicola]|uniref:Catalase core domain-containing protein n=1 Tax=Botryotinia narcissicola TaxID=278944 RepID=A0A4Z1J634_9HELO|nr:hypothetical protein BOTNAR_0049g00090 [Botryotinia narcissicola]
MGSIESEGLKSRNYIKWDASGVEVIPPNEQEDIQAIADQINAIQKAQFNAHRHCFGGTHARTQGLVKGELIIGDLPPHLAQSMFSRPKTYPIVMRYSTEPGDPALDDRIPQPRGLGMKVFNVDGERFDGKELSTQDIEFNSTPALDLADAKTTKEIIDLRIKYGGDKTELYKHLEARKDTALQKARDEVRNTHLESTRQYSQTAYRFGDYVVKYCLVPSSETQKKLYEETVKPDAHPDNILNQPVEYAGKVWDSEKYPWQTVATLKIPKQDSFIAARKTFWEDHMRLDPWHGLKSFQPLGSPNRLRKVVYPASSSFRRKMNGRQELDVNNIDSIPDGGWVIGAL